jgi:hypothetical protein
MYCCYRNSGGWGESTLCSVTLEARLEVPCPAPTDAQVTATQRGQGTGTKSYMPEEALISQKWLGPSASLNPHNCTSEAVSPSISPVQWDPRRSLGIQESTPFPPSYPGPGPCPAPLTLEPELTHEATSHAHTIPAMGTAGCLAPGETLKAGTRLQPPPKVPPLQGGMRSRS